MGDRPNLTRRDLLSAAAALSGAHLLDVGEPAAAGGTEPAGRTTAGGGAMDERLGRAYSVRVRAAREAWQHGAPAHPANGDEEELPRRIACFTKCLPHDAGGEVELRAYDFLLRALRSGEPKDFEAIPLGGFVKLANPQAAWAFELVGPDACQPALPPPPRFASAELAGEMVELYWQALARDIPFAEYPTHPVAARAAEELSRLSDFRGPKQGGRVTPGTLFRGPTPGDLAGPYQSQYLLKDIPFSPVRLEQRIRTAVPGVDYLTRFDDWLARQNGSLGGVNRFDPRARYLRSGRDIGEYVHRDFTYQAFLGACLAALDWGVLPDGGNPYKHSRTQAAFATFGPPYLLYLLAAVTQVALKACWFQKWRVHRRLRPEEYGGRIEAQRAGRASYPLPGELLGSATLAAVRERWGTALLPQAYPEGCPAHPSYPAGHAVIAGACATVLKAGFDDTFVVPDPVVASPDGTELLPWEEDELTVGGELDKLASNIAFGRNFAGIHWRSDGVAGLAFGEVVALEVLAEQALTGNELFTGYTLRTFGGRRIRVG